MPTSAKMIDALEHTADPVKAGRAVLIGIAGLIAIGFALSGFQNLPERVTALEAADIRMQESVGAIEDKMASLEREIRMMTCLQVAEMEDQPYQQCL